MNRSRFVGHDYALLVRSMYFIISQIAIKFDRIIVRFGGKYKKIL
jgi:hypothetical protein